MKNKNGLFSKLGLAAFFLPVGCLLGLAGLIGERTGNFPDFWTGFCQGSGVILALFGAAVWIVRLAKNSAGSK